MLLAGHARPVSVLKQKSPSKLPKEFVVLVMWQKVGAPEIRAH